MPKGVINEEYELCRALAQEIGNDSHPSIMRFKRELKNLRTWGDHEKIVRHGFNGVEVIGYSVDEIIECWRWLRTREEFPIRDARLSTCLLGSPCYLVQFDQWVMDNLPAVYDSTAHDLYVKRYAKLLGKLGFVYRAGRIEISELEKMGLNNA